MVSARGYISGTATSRMACPERVASLLLLCATEPLSVAWIDSSRRFLLSVAGNCVVLLLIAGTSVHLVRFKPSGFASDGRSIVAECGVFGR